MAAPAPHPRLRSFAERITVPRAIAAIVAFTSAFTIAAAALLRVVEPGTFRTFGRACWWAVQTVSTVGYGDDVPQTPAGRIVATAVMLLGIALVPAVTSIIVAILLARHGGSHR